MSSFEMVLSYFAKHRDLHARFLNTVSLLEYMGARKILKSQHETTISADILSHASEEIRHAQLFKKLALKVSEEKLVNYQEHEILCGSEARHYFQTLDHGCANAIPPQSTELNYLLTTLLIEERAGEIYPIYDRMLTECGIPSPLKGLIREEESHLEWIRKELSDRMGIEKLNELRALEKAAFEKWMQATIRECATETSRS